MGLVDDVEECMKRFLEKSPLSSAKEQTSYSYHSNYTENGIAVLYSMIGPSFMVSHSLITHLHQHDLSTMRPF